MRISIFKKIFISQLALIILASGALSLVGYFFMVRLYNDSQNNTLRRICSSTARTVAARVEQQKTNLKETVVNREAVHDFHKDLEQFPPPSDTAKEGSQKFDLLGDHVTQPADNLAGQEGSGVSLDIENQAILSEILLGTLLENQALRFSSAGTDYFTAQVLDLTRGRKLMAQIIEPAGSSISPKNGYCLIVAPDGKILADPEPKNIMKQLVIGNQDPGGLFAKVAADPDGQTHQAMLNGEDSYFSLALIPGTPWLAMSVLPSQQYNAVPKIFLSFSLILFLTLLFLAGIPAFFLAKSITSPLRKFAWASTAMAKGNFEQRVDAGNDEIGDLAKSFNLMAEKLGAAASREKLMLAAEASARLKAELANHHKNEFIAKISHELQTPLKTVLDMIKLLEAGDFSGTSQPEVAAIKKAGQDLFQLIDGILDFYRLENGTISLAPVPFDLYAILATLKKKYEPAARAKRITLVYAESEAVPTTVVGDEARIFQILGNLLDNAIKFTEHGEISLRVRPLGLKVINDQHIIHLRFEVADTGCGISLEQQTAIFDSFKSGESYMSRKADGLGIGLPLCQQLIDLMNGQIGMKSEPGQGSTFFVELNLPVAKEGPLAATLETTAPRAANGPIVQQNLGKVMQVLIAEDNPVARNLLRLMLEMRGHHVRVAENGKEAVAVYQSENLDLILMDIQMPGMNGFEATSAIRELEKHTDKHLPIIAVTAHVMPGYKDECLRAGLDNYLARPFRMQELFGMIDETLAQLNKQA